MNSVTERYNSESIAILWSLPEGQYVNFKNLQLSWLHFIAWHNLIDIIFGVLIYMMIINNDSLQLMLNKMRCCYIFVNVCLSDHLICLASHFWTMSSCFYWNSNCNIQLHVYVYMYIMSTNFIWNISLTKCFLS